MTARPPEDLAQMLGELEPRHACQHLGNAFDIAPNLAGVGAFWDEAGEAYQASRRKRNVKMRVQVGESKIFCVLLAAQAHVDESLGGFTSFDKALSTMFRHPRDILLVPYAMQDARVGEQLSTA